MEIGKNVFPCHRLVELHGFNLATCILHLTEKANMCLYGLPNEQWEVNLPAENNLTFFFPHKSGLARYRAG